MQKHELNRRLVHIKTLYELAVEHSRKVEPFSWFSILMFHDTVELFLELAAEFLNVSKSLKELKFPKYWGFLNQELKQKGKTELTQRIQMEKLNNSRIEFKHHGTEPSKVTIEDTRVNVTNFLEENMLSIFGVKFSEISLIDLIQNEKSRSSLKEAEALLQKGRTEDALDKIAIAFEQLVDDYESNKRDSYGRSMFSFPYIWRFDAKTEALGELERHFENIGNSIERLQEYVKILALGLDYRKYVKFQFLLARAILKIPNESGKIERYEIQRLERKIEDALSKEDIKYCMDFVIESAIVLREFDFELKPRKFPTLEDLF
jgi:hypothetical protein